MVGERSVSLRRCLVKDAGGIRSANADMSSDNAGEKPARRKRALLGVEQTANSSNLLDFKFPKKSVLLLGKEKEGIPVEYLNVLDQCIEIPQLGYIRSLNVHVSGSIMMWEYTRQRLLEKRSQ
eukprot:TRINITY_DN10647_c0_g1_i2.p1 TRINITY_DN10647_c0_g1~~TRINITY_DN10647_c0_g1_i2.p1  ORF type:complete len:123 (+),score=7.95 TRINITY_DN10647_c0_g1_i2:212-580(+)